MAQVPPVFAGLEFVRRLSVSCAKISVAKISSHCELVCEVNSLCKRNV